MPLSCQYSSLPQVPSGNKYLNLYHHRLVLPLREPDRKGHKSYSTNCLSVSILTQHNAFEVQQHCGMYQHLILLIWNLSSIKFPSTPRLSTQLPVDGYGGCFQFPAVMNNTSVDMHTEVFMQIWCFPHPWGVGNESPHRGEIADHREGIYAFKKLPDCFYKEVIRDILLIQFKKRWLSFPRATLGLVAAREGEDMLWGGRVAGTNSTRPC